MHLTALLQPLDFTVEQLVSIFVPSNTVQTRGIRATSHHGTFGQRAPVLHHSCRGRIDKEGTNNFLLGEFEALNHKMDQLEVKQPDPESQASPGSIMSDNSDKHWMASSRIPDIKLERTPSISDSYFSYPSRAPGKKKRVSTNGDGSPQRARSENSPQSSPERRRPLGPRRIISKGTTGPWVPPMPNIPFLPPPVPNHADVWQFGPSVTESTMESTEVVDEEQQEEESKSNPRRLSIPPSMVLRPLLAHGPLDASPKKAIVEAGAASLNDKALPPSPRRKRAETGGMLRAVMANAVMRRRNLTNPESRDRG